MTDLHFRSPQWLWMIAVTVVVAAMVRWWLRRRALPISALDLLDALPPPSRFRHLPQVALWMAFVASVLAAADPVVDRRASDARMEGLDIVMVVDLSSSMQEIMGPQPAASTPSGSPFAARDNAPRRLEGRTRLDATKDALKAFVAQRKGDRLGVVVFSDRAYLISPLTFDHDDLTTYIDMIDDQILRGEGMTAIGDGITMASQLLARQSTRGARNKVIVVFTDGENNIGRAPLEALHEADRAGYRVHWIGVDLEDEVKAKPAVIQLVSSVRALGGGYFTADSMAELRTAYEAIDRAERGSITVEQGRSTVPVFDGLAIGALLLVVMTCVARAFPFARSAS